MKRFTLALAVTIIGLGLAGRWTLAQQGQEARGLGPDQPGEDETLNRELWEYGKKTPYAQAESHIVRFKRSHRPAANTDVVLPTGWKIAPVGAQVAVGRLPYEAVAYAGHIVALNTGYHLGAKPDVSVVNPETGVVAKTVHLDALFPSAQVGQDGDLYISGGVSQKVFRLNNRFDIVKSYAVNGYAGGLAAIDADHLAVATMVASATQADFQRGAYQQGRLAILNTKTGAIEHEVALGYFPYTVRFVNGKLYATLLGENRVVIYSPQLDLLKSLEVGRTPQDLCADGSRLYVVNTGSDSLSVIDTMNDRLADTIQLHGERPGFGSAPSSCAVDGDRLYVAEANANAIAVLDKKTGKWLGSIPTGWYPTKVLFEKRWMLAVSAKGIHARRPNIDGPQADPTLGGSDYVLTLLKGSLSIIPKADIGPKLAAWTRVSEQGSPLYNPREGLKLPIRHVFYIVRENRTYDQVMGDLPKANGDSFLTLFGREITPNGHHIAEEFVTLDNYYADGEISVLGHSFTTSGYASPFLEWLGNMSYSGRYAGYPFGMVPAATSPAYLWDALDSKSVDYRIYGENYFLYTRAYDILKEKYGAEGALPKKFYAQMMALATTVDRGNAFYNLAKPYYGQASTPEDAFKLLDNAEFATAFSKFLCGDDSLADALKADDGLRHKFAAYLYRYPFNYRSWDLNVSDLERVQAWRADFEKQVQSGKAPQLDYIWLPNDHTGGTIPQYLPPDQLVAQNDAALAQIIDTVQKSPLWKESLIVVTEDDAQNGPDHVDATRTVALAIGPYVKRKTVVSDRYDQLSLLRTIEALLGLPPLNRNDALAVPMFGIFTDKPDFAPYMLTEPSTHLSDADRQRYQQLVGDR